MPKVTKTYVIVDNDTRMAYLKKLIPAIEEAEKAGKTIDVEYKRKLIGELNLLEMAKTLPDGIVRE